MTDGCETRTGLCFISGRRLSITRRPRPRPVFSLMALCKGKYNKKADARYKYFCFTLFGENEPKFNKEKMEYMCYGRETCPETHRIHFQGFISFKIRQRFSGVKKMVPGAHTERCKGSVEENISYCSKDGDFYEHGERPKGNRSNSKFSEVLAAAE